MQYSGNLAKSYYPNHQNWLVNQVKISFSIPRKCFKAETIPHPPHPNNTKSLPQPHQPMNPEIEPTSNLQNQTLPKTEWNFSRNLATIELPLKNIKGAIQIPSEAVVPVQDGKVVYIANNGTCCKKNYRQNG